MKTTTGTITATGTGAGVPIIAKTGGNPPDVAAIVGIGGTFTSAPVQVDTQFIGGSLWYPAAMVDRSSGAKSVGSATTTNSTGQSWKVDVAGCSEIRVSVPSGTPTSMNVEVVTGQKSEFDSPLQFLNLIYADDITFAAGITFSGTTGINILAIPDNLADALSIAEGANEYLTFTTTNASEAIALKKNTTLAGTFTLTSASATAVTIGRQGATNPGFAIDLSTATNVTGWKITPAAVTAGAALAIISSGTNEPGTIDAKGSGVLSLQSVATGTTYLNRGGLKAPVLGLTLTALGTTQNSTPTLAQLIGGIVTQTGTTGAGTVTLPSGTTVSGAMPLTPVAGDSFDVVFASLTGQALTITGATGTTVIGTAAIPSGKNAFMRFVNTGTNTWNIYVIVSA